jgi:hypothetical protein
LVQKVRSNRARALHHSNEMQLFCEKQRQLGGEWLVALLTHAHCRSDMRFWGRPMYAVVTIETASDSDIPSAGAYADRRH